MTEQEKNVMAVELRRQLSDMIRSLDNRQSLIFETRDSAKLKRLRNDLMDLCCDLSRFLI